jgi:asparagine synthase (glutamine-hydrolysing)
MCGVAGLLNLDGTSSSRAIVERMTAALAHRGPDGEGYFTDGAVGLGHRRLAIIDLSDAARQPMLSADGRYALSYNGEIYNFRDLRRELEERGQRLHTRSDSEVLLCALAVWGEAALERLNGMFAFALWDRDARELLIARDRFGVKPLYYGLFGRAFAFASEIKALLQHPGYRANVDKEALLEYFTFQNIFTDRTLFSEIKLLPPGTLLRVSEARGMRRRRYWDFHFAEPSGGSDEREYEEELDRLFRQAVKRQLVSDVPVGSYLSGGLDSGSITAVASREQSYIRTFTAGFDMRSASGMELTFDEREKAEHMSYLFKTEHYEMVLKAGDMERVMPRLVYHLEDLRVGQCYPNFYVAQLASRFVKVVLSGTGGDELFGGYPWRYYRALVNDDFEQYIDKYYGFWQRLIPNTSIRAVFSPIWNDVRHVWTRDLFRDVFSSVGTHLTGPRTPEDYVNHSLYFEARTFLHGLLLVEDKLSMAHGLETRVPFLDNDLADFAMRLPARMRLGNMAEIVELNENEPGPKTERYFRATRDGKLILRKAMQRHVPAEVTEGIKQGFSAPDASWFKGESIDYVRKALMGQDAMLFAYLDRSAVQALVREHLEGRLNRRLLIWSLLCFEWWCRAFLR